MATPLFAAGVGGAFATEGIATGIGAAASILGAQQAREGGLLALAQQRAQHAVNLMQAIITFVASIVSKIAQALQAVARGG